MNDRKPFLPKHRTGTWQNHSGKPGGVFDRSSCGGRIMAERSRETGGEQHHQQYLIREGLRALGNEDGDGAHSGFHVPEGRNDDPLLYPDRPDLGRLEPPDAYRRAA